MRGGRWAVVVLALTGCLACAAQQLGTTDLRPLSKERPKPATGSVTGSVTGTVYCADTNAPARAATVMLIPAGNAGIDPAALMRTTTQTDLDGRFTMPKVPEGTYYVQAEFPGYRKPLPFSLASFLKPLTPEQIKLIGPDAPKVIVASKQAATVAIRLERGGEIEGVVRYDDGSPAVGLRVMFVLKNAGAPGKPDEPENQFATVGDFIANFNDAQRPTDDRGRFRILGLDPGEYVVGVSVPVSSADDAADNLYTRLMENSPIGDLTVYSGDTMRKSKATPVKVANNDSSKDVDITIPLSKLHTVRGHVTFKSTGEAPPTAALELLYADNHEVARVILATNGEFALAYVPEGNYILAGQGMKEQLPSFDDEDGVGGGFLFQGAGVWAGDASTKQLADFLDSGGQVPVTVAGDVTGLSISVPDPPAVKPGTETAPMKADPDQPNTPQ